MEDGWLDGVFWSVMDRVWRVLEELKHPLVGTGVCLREMISQRHTTAFAYTNDYMMGTKKGW